MKKRILIFLSVLFLLVSIVPIEIPASAATIENNGVTGNQIVQEARSWKTRRENGKSIYEADYFSEGGLSEYVARRTGYNAYVGRSDLSFDCSGFVCRVLNDVGIRVTGSNNNEGTFNRVLYDKYGSNHVSSDAQGYICYYGEDVSNALEKAKNGDLSDLRPGDLLGWKGGSVQFPESENHIAIYAGNGEIVHFTGGGFKDEPMSDDYLASFKYARRLAPSYKLRSEYPCDITVQTKTSNVEAWSMPGNTETYPESRRVGKYNTAGQNIHVRRIIENDASVPGHFWYETVYPPTGETAYVWYKNVDEVSQNWTIHASNPSKPGTLKIGDTFIVSGSAYTDGCMISAIRGFIYPGNNTSGEAEEQSEAAYPNSVSCDLSLIDNTMYFNHISTAGYHTYTVKAALHNYHLVDGSPKLEARAVEINDVTTKYFVGESTPESTAPGFVDSQILLREYSAGVAPGQIRYVSQNSSLSANGWGAYDYLAGGECGYASQSMALSYLGKDVSPEYLCYGEYSQGKWQTNYAITYDVPGISIVSGSGAKSGSDAVNTINTMLSNHIDDHNTGNYSPVVIHYRSGSTMHAIIIAGKNADGTYVAVDPARGMRTCTFSISSSGVVSGDVTYGSSGLSVDRVEQYRLTDLIPTVSPEMTSGAGRTIPDGNYIIVSAADPDYYLDIDGNDYPAADNANVTLWGRRSETLPPEDTWTVTYIDDGGFYSIRQNGTNMALDVSDASARAGANVQVYTYYGSNAQKWSISQNNNGSYRIQAKCSGLNLDITSANIDAGTNIEQWTVHDGAAQQWNFVPYPAFTPCTVTYDANGGVNPPDDQYTTYGNDTVVISAEKPSRASTDAGSCTVTLNANGGSGTTPPLNAQRTTSYSFKDWNSAADGSRDSYTPGVGYTIEKDITLFAQWYANTTTDSVILPTLTRDGYVCRGWATNSTATIPQYTAGSSFVPEGDVTLYAVWEKGILTDWSETKPEGVDNSLIDTRTQYRYRDKETMNSTESAIDGWVFESSEQRWSDYGPWSDWDTDEVTASDSCQVETTPLYLYYYFLCPQCGRHEPFTGTCDCGQYTLSGSDWNETWSTIPYSDCSYGTFSYTTEKYYTTSLGDGQVWCFSSGNLYDTAIGTKDTTSDGIVIKQGYRCRTRALEMFNVFYRWSDWSEWSNNEVSASNTREVDTRIMYRYLIKDYAISFNANGGTGAPEAQTKTHGQPLTLSSTVPTRAGYTFLGWAESADATVATYQPGGEFVKNADTTLYAVWQKKEPDFTLPAGLKEIDEEAFANCAFGYVHIPDGVTRIERRAFADCPNLHDVDIPESATSIDPTAFAGTNGLTIHSADGSYAEFYAGKYGFAFIPVA